jgi:hypothetical protein
MIAARQAISNRFGGAILEDEATIVTKHGIADGGFNAHACSPSRKNQALDGAASKKLIQIRLVEPAVSVLIENHVAGFGLEFGNYVGVPCIANQNTTCRSMRRRCFLTCAQWQMLKPVGRIRSARVREIGAESHLQIDDKYPGLACSGQYPTGRRYDGPIPRDIDPGERHHPAMGSEVVLHVDDDDGGSCRLDHQRLGPSVNSDPFGFRCHLDTPGKKSRKKGTVSITDVSAVCQGVDFAMSAVCPVRGDLGSAGNVRPTEARAPLLHDRDALTTAAPGRHLRGVTAS